MVLSPTRENNILDLVLVNDPSQVADLQTLEHFGQSDHNMISFGLQCPIPRASRAPRKSFLYGKGDNECLNSELELHNWDSIFHGKSIQQCWDKFKEMYEILINTLVPHTFNQVPIMDPHGLDINLLEKPNDVVGKCGSNIGKVNWKLTK